MHINEMTKYRELPGDICSLRPEVLECLVEGLQFLKSDASAQAQQLATRLLANIIIEHLDVSGYGIHRKALPQDKISERDGVYSLPTM